MDKKEPLWAKYITEENLPTEDLQVMASLIGLEATKKLMFEFQGYSFTFPKNFANEYKKQYIVENYDHTNKTRKHLALECGVTERYIYQIVKNNAEGKKK